MEYHSTVKRNEVLACTTAWMNLETIMLSKQKPITKDHILYDSTCMSRIDTPIET